MGLTWGVSATWRIMTGGLVKYFKGGFVLRLWALGNINISVGWPRFSSSSTLNNA
jgi:hypothetical protein